MEIRSLSDEQFNRLIESMVTRLKVEMGAKRDKWVDGNEAMRYMRITSKTTLQKLRDEGKIRFSQPLPKHLLYDLDSIDEYLNRHANK